MKMMKRMTALLCLLALVLPVFAAETAETPTLPPVYVGVQQMTRIPDNWNPLGQPDADRKTVLNLTAEPLYRLSGAGELTPAQAAAMPVDVTMEFAGSYGIPAGAYRGYAYAIELRKNTFWDDGTALTVADWCYTVEMLLEQEMFPLEIANYEAYRRGDTHPASQIVSLQDAGYATVAEAETAGYKDFYLDTTWFWGLETGWLRITDRTRLFDEAIPSGCEEMYITPAYLYRTYLSENGSQKRFQSEFVGIPTQPGEPLALTDVGFFAEDGRLVLILQEQTAASTLALALTDLYPVPTGTQQNNYGTAANYRSCGPYRITAVTGTEMILEPNPHWAGTPTAYESVRLTVGS